MTERGNRDEKGAGTFYDQALSRAERVRLSKARQVQGLDEEIALLRVRLSKLAGEHPEKLDLLYKGIRLLIQAVATKYRLSPKAKDDLFENVLGVVKGVGAVLMPEGMNGAEEQ